MSNCSGIKYLTIETLEPAQVNFPIGVQSIAIVNNVVQQPDEVGHDSISIGKTQPQRIKVSSDSVAVYYTEALAQFLNEEEFFEKVVFYNKPLRTDNDFFVEKPIDPETMQKIRKETGTDAIISLDKLLIKTKKKGHFRQQGYSYEDLTAWIYSTFRVYMPTQEGKIPAIEYTDSINWEGFYIHDGNAYADVMIPSTRDAIKTLAVVAAEKMTKVFAPYWEMQDRWYYTLPNSLMKEGDAFAKKTEWENAINRWEKFYNNTGKKIDKAKAANNIALAYEMLDEMEQALKWATTANDLFVEATAPNSMERRRSLLYKNEIQRRLSNIHKSIDMN